MTAKGIIPSFSWVVPSSSSCTKGSIGSVGWISSVISSTSSAIVKGGSPSASRSASNVSTSSSTSSGSKVTKSWITSSTLSIDVKTKSGMMESLRSWEEVKGWKSSSSDDEEGLWFWLSPSPSYVDSSNDEASVGSAEGVVVLFWSDMWRMIDQCRERLRNSSDNERRNTDLSLGPSKTSLWGWKCSL